ncbi:MAG: (d)CMP kinase [Dehalococcoidia bacterium]
MSDPPAPIAIDGPAASGKSTLGRRLADELGYVFLDTGLMYRAYTLAALRAKVPADDVRANEGLVNQVDLRVRASLDTHIFLGDEDVTARLRDPEVEANVSAYSVHAAVREVMVEKQREVAESAKAILAGRDIGTVVLPDAPLKFYLEASPDARAERRSRQAGHWGRMQEPHEAHRDITGRDVIDSGRATSPLRPAEDAIVIDTTHMTMAEVIEYAREKVRCASA